MVERCHHDKSFACALRRRVRGEEGYILPLVMLVLVALLMYAATLLTNVLVNHQHVSRERSYTQALTVAEAGLNQYLWMVASGGSSEANNFAIVGNGGPDPHYKSYVMSSTADGSNLGTYAVLVTPPSPTDSRIRVTVSGKAYSPVEASRTVTAHLGRPAFSEYVLLVDEEVYIGGPANRVWHGKTHSNTGIRIETANITDPVTCARSTYNYGGTTKPGIWSQDLPSNSPSKNLWFPGPAHPAPAMAIDFNTVTSDFARLRDLAASNGSEFAYATASAHDEHQGWYIKILPGRQYQYAKVTAETEDWDWYNWATHKAGGSLTYGTLSSPVNYPFKGVIYVNDNVWIEGTNIDGRLTIASSGQLNPTGKRNPTSIHVVGDLTYSHKDGTVALGMIAQDNVEIPMYAPYQKTPASSWTDVRNLDMEIDAALIAQQGAEFVNRNGTNGPRRDTLTIYGSVSSLGTPSRMSYAGDDDNPSSWAGFRYGANTYDSFLLHNPPPYFPTVGSYQILDWQELPNLQGVPF